MRITKKLKLMIIVLSVMTLSISSHYIWDLRQAERTMSPYHEIDNLTNYNITVEFLEEAMTLKGSQEVTYIHQQEASIRNLYFHLYPNAFKTKERVPFEKGMIERVYPNGFDPGYIEIISIKEGKKAVDYRIMGEGATIVRITPEKPVNKGESLQLFIDFKVKIPNTIGRMGYGENTVNITNWFPILAVYDERGWNLDPYYAIGDPFYSEVARYNVTAVLPEEYKLAVTGNVIEEYKRKEKTTYKIEADLVRNFVMILSKKFDVKEAMLQNTKILSYSVGGLKGEVALQYGLDALKIFNTLFGKYPYDQLSIAACDFFVGGMEYPNVVMISQDLYKMKEDFPLEYVIAHEIAHQWWYGIVGNNEIREPWLDEALTEYSTLMYFEKKYGPHIKEQVFEKMIKAQYENYIDFQGDKGEEILRSLREFDSSWQYSSIVYSKGALFIHALREEMGDEAFIKALREYFETFKFKNATTEDFYRICEKNTDQPLKQLFNQWLNAAM